MNKKYIVESKSRSEIRSIATQFREKFGLQNELYFPIEKILDILSLIMNKFNYEIVEDDVLPQNTHAKTNISTGVISIKQSIYEGACEGKGRDRFTIAHEIGHFLMFCVYGFDLYENNGDIKIPPYQDPEWQADCFAGELMIPKNLVENMMPDEIVKLCGVSLEAAQYQYNIYQKEKL